MLVVDGLTCRFGTKAAVDNASFAVPPGSFVGVIGRSGAGKSTLLRMINRLAEPTQGRILFEGVDVTALRGKDLRQWRARSAMIFQQFNLVGRLDVLTNVLMGRLAGIPISVKDLFDVAGERTAAGSRVLADATPATAHATSLALLRKIVASPYSGPTRYALEDNGVRTVELNVGDVAGDRRFQGAAREAGAD